MEKSEGITIPHEKPWRYEEGEYTVTRGSAWSGPGCHLGCGVLMYTDKDGKLVKAVTAAPGETVTFRVAMAFAEDAADNAAPLSSFFSRAVGSLSASALISCHLSTAALSLATIR